MSRQPGTLLLVLVLTVLYLAAYSREVFHDGGPPAFFVERREGVTVMLRKGFPYPGVHQFYDGATPASVMKMTGLALSPRLSEASLTEPPLRAGEVLDFALERGKVVDIKRNWMMASQRMTLGIPLHPDRMTLRDWEALPGIGPRLAERIEKDRQQNGEFGSLEALDRVSGIGRGRLASWEVFF